MQAALLPRWSFRSAVLSPLHDLSATVRLVLVALDNYRSDKSQVPFPSQETLAGDTHLDVRTVRGALAVAQEHGWCLRVARYRKGGGRMNDGYELSIPDSMAGAGSGKVGGIPESLAGIAGARSGEVVFELSSNYRIDQFGKRVRKGEPTKLADDLKGFFPPKEVGNDDD